MSTATLHDWPVWQLGAHDLHQAYQEGRTNPVRALQAHLDRLETVQPIVNAMAWVDEAGARAAAKASAERWRRGQPLSALDGVPITVKDNIPVAGMPCRWGSRVYADHWPLRDESPVARLREAGAVILGKTTVPEFTLLGHTDSPLTGLTRNPWNPSLTPGGSSGGAVAALAAGVGALAIGTDGGGSIRRPAGFTGLYGLKPGWGTVPRRDGLPDTLPEMEVVGPMGRRVLDLVHALETMAGERPGAWRGPRHALAAPQRIAYWRHIAGRPVDPRLLAVCDAAAQQLRELGHTVVEADAPPEVDAFNQSAWPVISATGLAHALSDRPDASAQMGPAMAALLARGQALRATDLAKAQAQVRQLKVATQGLWATHDLLLTPTSAALPWPAADTHPAEIDGQPVDGRGHAVFTAFANATGLPALALPAGRTHGLPVGMQLVGRPGAEALLLALGLQWESTCGPCPAWPLWP